MFHGQQPQDDKEAWFKWAEAEESIVMAYMGNDWKLYPVALMNQREE